MDVSIIIVNYNTKKMTSECIESVFTHTKGIAFEIILVDNASCDGSIEYFKKFRNITFVSSEENLGFGRANNLGLHYASGKYVFLLNSDTLLLNNAILKFFVEAEKMDEDIASLGCVLLDENLKNTHSFGDFPTLWGDILFQSVRLPISKMFKQKTNKIGCDISNTNDGFVDYITGADLFIRKKVIDKLGFFNPSFFMYFEETDLQKRYNKAGYKSKIITSPKIIHLEGGSNQSSNKSLKKSNILLRSKLTYFKLWNNGFVFKLYLLLLLILRLPFLLFSKYELSERKKYLNNILVFFK